MYGIFSGYLIYKFVVDPDRDKDSPKATYLGSVLCFAFLGLIKWENTEPTLSLEEMSGAVLTENQGIQKRKNPENESPRQNNE